MKFSIFIDIFIWFLSTFFYSICLCLSLTLDSARGCPQGHSERVAQSRWQLFLLTLTFVFPPSLPFSQCECGTEREAQNFQTGNGAKFVALFIMIYYQLKVYVPTPFCCNRNHINVCISGSSKFEMSPSFLYQFLFW